MKSASLFTSVAFFTLFGQTALYAQATWIGVDAANWNVAGNWSGTAPSDNGTSALTFNYAGSNLTSTNGLNNLTVSSLIFASGSRDNTLNGNAITLAGTITDSTGAWQTINLPMALTTGEKSFDIQTGQLTIGGIMSGTGGLTKTGGSTLILNQKNTYSGGTIVNSGTLRLATGGSVGAITGTVTVNSGATLESTNGDSFGYNSGTKVNTLNLNGGTLTHSSGNNLTIASAVINLTGGVLQATSSGALDLYDATGTNTSINSLASASSSTISGKIYLGAGDNDSTGTVFTVADGTAADDLIVSASMSNRGSNGANAIVQKAGAGCLVVSGTNTYTGATKVTGGTLKAGSTQALGSNSAVVMTNTAATALDLNSYSNSIGSLTGGGTTGGNVALGTATLTVGGDNTSPAAYAGVISGTGALIKSGSGTLNLSGSNTFSGGTTVNGGTLQLSTGGSVGAIRGTVTVNAGATLLTSAGDAFGFGTGTKVNTLNIVGGTVTHNATGNATLCSAVINLTGGTLQATGSGNFDFFNNGTGNTAVNSLASGTSSTIAGKVNLRQGDNDPTGTVFTVADGTAANDLVVSATLANGTYEGANSAIQKSGTGVMVLTATNTYSGPTTVNAGTLLVNGSLQNTSLTTVATGATLGGTGTIASAVNVSGVIAPGAGIAALATGSLSLLNGARYAYDLNTTTHDGDLLNVGGNLGINSGVTLDLTDLTTSHALTNNTKLSLISYSGSWNHGTFTGLADDSIFTLGANQWRINYNDVTAGSNLLGGGGYANFVTMTVIPEPSVAALAWLTSAALCWRRRRV
jgi:autotransporter-associated beta strand protein